MFSCVNDKESDKVPELRRNIIYMLGSLEISSTCRLGGGWRLEVGMPARLPQRYCSQRGRSEQ